MIDLFSYNLTAYESAVRMLSENGKAAIIHPTGTGKSFIGFKLCEDNEKKRVLWLSPSEYIFKTQIENLKVAANGYAPNNILFYTYARLTYMSMAEIACLKPDYIVLDEFHRCGAQVWGKGVQSVLNWYPRALILGLTATNIRYLDNQRDMADELFDGYIASRMTLGEAIVRGILNPPKYVLSVIQYQKDLEKYSYRVKRAKNKAVRDEGERCLEALHRVLDKAEGLSEIFTKYMPNKKGKYIVFCSGVKHMDEMALCAGDWFKNVDLEPHIYKAYSDEPETSKEFERFKKDNSEHLKLLYCIDMLNEGVHVEDISGVILLRPTVSPIIYKQQIGRALSANKTDAVIFDIVLNIDNLYSIGAVQNEMRVAMEYYREHGKENEIINEHFKIVGEMRDCVQLFQKLNDTLSASWDFMFAIAKKYYEDHGDLRVPTKYKTEQGYSLGNWLMTQRKVRRGEQFGTLSDEKIEKLDAIGMIWENSKDTAWSKYYSAALSYVNENGDFKVPAAYRTKDGLKLGSWVSNLRVYRRNGAWSSYLTTQRISALDAIGMVWDVPDALWERNYAAAKAYYDECSDLNVPLTYVSSGGVKLGTWLNNIRNSYLGANRDYKLTNEQIAALEGIGMEWTPRREMAWYKGYAAAKAYYERYGNLNVASSYVNERGYKLGAWVCHQRARMDKMPKEKREKLDTFGMVWKKPDSWETRFAIAKAYYDKFGDLNVPSDYTAAGVRLNKWLNEQKQIYNGKRKGKTLTREQTARLEAIGVRWNKRAELSWNEHYEACLKCYEQFGRTNFGEYKSADATVLSAWWVRQKAAYKSGKLSWLQIEKLEAIGMVWEPPDAWETGFAHAKEYAELNGHLLVRSGYECSDGYKLGGWIANQRANKARGEKDGQLNVDRIERLQAIGMVWNVSDYLWTRAYEAAVQFYVQNGHLHVPINTVVNGTDLQSWLSEQKKKYKRGKLSQERALKLAAIGVIVLPEARLISNKAKAAANK